MAMASCMFERLHHRRIAQLLSSLDADFLLACGCYFGGGTAIDKARLAYGQSIDIAYDKALGLIADPAHLAACLQKMHMDPDLAARIPDLLHGARPGKTAV